MKKKVLSLLIAAFVVLSSSISYAANWQWVLSDDEYGYFFDTETIHFGVKLNSVSPIKKSIDKNKILFWEKIFFTQKGANSVAISFKDVRFQSLDHCLSQMTYSIPDRTTTYHLLVFYDKDGNIIEEARKEHTEKILPDSNGEHVFNIICLYTKNHDLEVSANTPTD